jgi:hypothetical protein
VRQPLDLHVISDLIGVTGQAILEATSPVNAIRRRWPP